MALGTRSEFRTAWLMKCCFRLEAESLFTWELARAGRQPGRGLWARCEGAVLRAKTDQDAQAQPYHRHSLTAIPCLVSLHNGKLTPYHMCSP